MFHKFFLLIFNCCKGLTCYLKIHCHPELFNTYLFSYQTGVAFTALPINISIPFTTYDSVIYFTNIKNCTL